MVQQGWEMLAMSGVTTFRGLMHASFCFALLFLIVWVLLVACLKKTGTTALKCTVLVHHLLVGPAALVGIASDPALREAFKCFGCQEAAIHLLRDPVGPSAPLLALAPVTLGYMLLDLALFPFWDLSGKKDRRMALLMVCHHVFSLISWPFAVKFDFCARYVLVLLAYEVSSIFLVIKWMLSAAGWKQGCVFMVNGALFTGSFLLIRVVGAFPQLRAVFLAPPWGVSAEEYQLLWWMPLGSTWLVLPFLLNFYWGYKVFWGSVALLRGRSGQKTRREQLSDVLLVKEQGT